MIFFLKVKFFPNKIEDYLYFLLSNIIFLFILVSIVEKTIEQQNKNKDKSEIMLFIPKVSADFEEKRDLIFNQLSVNTSIFSVNKLEEKEVKKTLSDLLNNIVITDDIIPEVYEVQVERKKNLNFDLINNKISKIIEGAVLQNIKYKTSLTIIIIYSSLMILIITILLNNFFIIKNSLFKIKDYLNISRYFGVNDFVIIKNLNIGFFFLLNLVFLISYFMIKVVSEFYKDFIILNGYLNMYIVIYVIYNITFLLILSIQCKVYMKKLNIL